MATQLKLQRNQLADLESLRDLGPDPLQRIVDHLQTLEPIPLRPHKLRDAIVEGLGDREDVADSVVRTALSLHGLIRQGGLAVDEVFDGIRFSIEAESEWTDAEKEKWQVIAPVLRNLVTSRAVRLVTTAIDLSYEYANLLRRARILTDIRPLYNVEATEIEGAVVSHTLRLRYDSIEGDHQLSIAMDELDIRELKKQCDRALQKATTARDLMKSRANIPTVISGGDDDA